jgi:transcription elongation factor GreA
MPPKASTLFNFSNSFLSLYNQCNASASLGRCYFFLFSPCENFKMEVHMESIQYVTKETLEQMKVELQRMKGVERPAASRAIAEAREKGDLKENAEYDAAKEAQGLLEAKIVLLESQIASARIVDQTTIDTSKVTILTRVKLINLNTKKEVTYQIVSEKEANLKAGKISSTSPIGKGLLGKKVGDTAEVQAPAGVIKFQVQEISI